MDDLATGNSIGPSYSCVDSLISWKEWRSHGETPPLWKKSLRTGCGAHTFGAERPAQQSAEAIVVTFGATPAGAYGWRR